MIVKKWEGQALAFIFRLLLTLKINSSAIGTPKKGISVYFLTLL